VTIARSARLALAIHDLRGRALRTIEPGTLGPGRHDLAWDLTDDRGAPAPTGIYFCRLLVDGMPADSRRIVVLR
jgi:flagellar hook assembly protein FlgD